MRRIDADNLKEKLDELEPYIDCDENSTTWILSDEVYNAIGNAPTVELTEAEVQETLSKRCMTAVANEYLMRLITLQGKRPQGEWLDIYTSHIAYECSNCHMQMPTCDYYHFCPNCGADMRKGGTE